MAREFNTKKSDKQSGSTPSSDSRLARSADEESRLVASGDRTAIDEREAQDTERFDATVEDWSFDKMPGLPEFPGFKSIWLSTTHKQDTIQRRMRLGYIPIRAEEVEDLKHLANKTGPYEGMIQCEEMVAFKLPEALWLKYMTHFHHTKPLSDEAGIREEIERVQERASSVKGRVDLEDGMKTLGQVRRPKFN